MDLFFAFMLALITYYINQRIQKVVTIKILINSLFDIYGNANAFLENPPDEVASKLMIEIIEIEKKIDNEHQIEKEVEKLKKLRLIYFKFNNESVQDIEQKIAEIGFVKLSRAFIILSLLNIK